jgi:hypothetical protein
LIKKIRIGCASGFWGDTDIAAPQIVEKGDVDYLVFDYLSEVTMSILAGAKLKNSNKGYAIDFINHIGPLLKKIKQKKIKVISNAGGVNLDACKKALIDEAEKKNINLKIATVEGDDLIDCQDKLSKMNIKEIESEKSLPKNLLSINVYLGANPIKRALDLGADIVLTGRCVDSALALGPLMHEFKWGASELDHLASGSLVGHIIECGAQVTGGNFTDWESLNNFANIGFPVVEVEQNGDFIVTKPKGTGGMVNFGTVAEQLLYEIGDPKAYILPDVICDFTEVEITELGKDRVHVTGAKGYAAPIFYKVSATYHNGFKSVATLVIGGQKAVKKAYSIGNSILKRVEYLFKKNNFSNFKKINLSVIGSDDIKDLKVTSGSNEVVMRLAVAHENKEALIIFSREIAQAATGMAPGVMNYLGGRPSISPLIKLYSFLINKNSINCSVNLDSIREKIKSNFIEHYEPILRSDFAILGQPDKSLDFEVPLIKLAYARSGDKGNHVNIGVISRKSDYFPFIKDSLNMDIIAKQLKNISKESILCWELPKIYGLNFLLKNCLDGGGMSSLLLDPQGKGYAQNFLNIKISVPESVYNEVICV